jgi:hypothetical protein
MSTIPYGQACKNNEGEELGIELTIELTTQNSKHKCWQQHTTTDMCGKLSVAFVECQLVTLLTLDNLYWHVSGN